MTMLNKGSIHSQSSSFTGMLFQLFLKILISIEIFLKKLNVKMLTPMIVVNVNG